MTTSSSFTRRTAVVGGGAAACACALAACGGGNSGGSSEKVDAMIPQSAVPVGGGFVDTKNNVVVCQPSKGQYKAFSSVCTHQGCQVSAPQDGVITCNCHGSTFDVTSGEVKAGPADKALPAKKVAVSGSNLHVTG